MSRCYLCGRWIWPWQHFGFLAIAPAPTYRPVTYRRWHTRCATLAG